MDASHARHQEPRSDDADLTANDLDVLLALEAYRMLTARDLVAFVGSQRTYRNIQKLRALGLIERIPAARFFPEYGHVVALSTEGARFVARCRNKPAPRTDFSRKNREYRPWRLPHKLLTNRTRLAFERACRGRADVRLLGPAELRARMPEAFQRRTKPFVLSAVIEYEGEEREAVFEPDDVIALEFLGRAEREALKLMPIEADCATEIIQSETFDTRIVQSKLTAYLAYAQQKGPQKQFGIGRMQVLFPTSGDEQRIARFVKTTEAVTDGAGSRRFLFAQADLLFGDVLATTWIDGTGTPASVME